MTYILLLRRSRVLVCAPGTSTAGRHWTSTHAAILDSLPSGQCTRLIGPPSNVPACLWVCGRESLLNRCAIPAHWGRIPAPARQSLVTRILQFNSTRSTFNKAWYSSVILVPFALPVITALPLLPCLRQKYPLSAYRYPPNQIPGHTTLLLGRSAAARTRQTSEIQVTHREYNKLPDMHSVCVDIPAPVLLYYYM